MIIGAHLSIAKGMPVAIDQAQSIGANVSIFTRNPEAEKPGYPVEEMEEFQTYRISAGSVRSRAYAVYYQFGHQSAGYSSFWDGNAFGGSKALQ